MIKESGIDKILKGECPLNTLSPMACTFCGFGHMLYCHYPLTCDEAKCDHIKDQDEMCIGKLPERIKHDEDWNTHRLCINTTETGHGIFDLQINWTDCWTLIRLLNRVKTRKQ